MSHRTCRYAIAYDISDDRERGKVDKLLKGWGHRAQKSVFMVMTTRYGSQQLQAELSSLRLRTGNVLIFRLQAEVSPIVIGTPYADPDATVAYVV